MYALVIGRSYPDAKTGMMGIFEFEQAVALNNNGYRAVYFFCDTRSIKKLQKYGNYYSVSKGINVYGFHLPIGGIPQKVFSKIKMWYYKKVMKEIINAEGIPDIIHVHFPIINLTDEIWEFLKSFNRPIVVTEHWSKVQVKDLEPFRITLLKRIVIEAEEFLCVGEQLKKSVLELTNTDKNIKVLPNMVSPMFYYEESMNNKNDTFEFITVGRLIESKRFGLVIEAFTKTFLKNNNVRLTIVGGGPMYEKLRRQIYDLGMNNKITMLGFTPREETARLIRRSGAFVSGSVLETFGVPFVEAMSCGKPVIGIKNGPIDKFIDEDNGVQFEKDNIDSLINAFSKLYNNRKKYDGKRISDKAQMFFSEISIANQLKTIYTNHLMNKK